MNVTQDYYSCGMYSPIRGVWFLAVWNRDRTAWFAMDVDGPAANLETWATWLLT